MINKKCENTELFCDVFPVRLNKNRCVAGNDYASNTFGSIKSGCCNAEVNVGGQTKRRTNQRVDPNEFAEEVARLQPDIILLGRYVNNRTKILCKCRSCGREWESQPNTIRYGKGCLWCAGIKITHDEFIRRIAELHPSIKVIDQYVATAVNVLCECQICGLRWQSLPSTLYNGKGCLRCSGSYRRNHQEFVDDLAKIDSKIEVIGTYVDTKTHVECRCRDCGHSWQAVPRRLLAGKSCPECSKKRMGDASRKTHEQFVAEIEGLLPSVEVVSQYEGWDRHVQCRCKICGNEWKIIPYYLRHSDGCPECIMEKNGSKVYSRKIDPEREKARREKLATSQRKSHEQFLLDAEKANPKLTITGKYINNKTKVECQCKQCGHSWSMLPGNVLKQRGCPNCATNQTSFLERYILFTLQKVLGEKNVLPRDMSIGKELDIYIPSLNAAIEPGSYFWHKSKIKSDMEKYDLCRQNGIRLMIIYDDFDDDRNDFDFNNDIVTYKDKLSEPSKRNELKSCIENVFLFLGLSYDLSENENLDLITKAKTSTCRKTTADFLVELQAIHPNVELLDEYCGTKIKMKCRCNVCGNEWNSNYDHLIGRKQGCPKCNSNKKRVVNLDTGEVFNSLVEAGNFVGLTSAAIRAACCNENRTCNKHHWAYLQDLTPDQLADLRTRFPNTFNL